MEEREREGQPFSSLLVSRLEIKLRSRARPQRPPPPLKVHLNQGHRSSDHPPTPFSLSPPLSRVVVLASLIHSGRLGSLALARCERGIDGGHSCM